MTVAYEGHLCRYTTNGEITDTGITAANRNGRYKVFCARACGRLHIQIEII
jgi:heme/copper-type cytochrome/quinol oxidase subunit 2